MKAALNPRSKPNQLCIHTLQQHTGRVFRLQFDDFQIVSSSHDDTILIWDFARSTVDSDERDDGFDDGINAALASSQAVCNCTPTSQHSVFRPDCESQSVPSTSNCNLSCPNPAEMHSMKNPNSSFVTQSSMSQEPVLTVSKIPKSELATPPLSASVLISSSKSMLISPYVKPVAETQSVDSASSSNVNNNNNDDNNNKVLPTSMTIQSTTNRMIPIRSTSGSITTNGQNNSHHHSTVQSNNQSIRTEASSNSHSRSASKHLSPLNRNSHSSSSS